MVEIVLTICIVILLILFVLLIKVNKKNKKQQENRILLRDIGKKLLEHQIEIICKESQSETDKLFELEMSKYLKDWLLDAMLIGICSKREVEIMHGLVVKAYPDVFDVLGNKED